MVVCDRLGWSLVTLGGGKNSVGIPLDKFQIKIYIISSKFEQNHCRIIRASRELKFLQDLTLIFGI